MFKPRIPKTGKVNKDDVQNKLLTLKAEISALETSESEIFKSTCSFDDVVEILQKENESLSKLLHYEETVKKNKLEEEKITLLREKEEEENWIAICSDFVKNGSFVRGETIDKSHEMLLKQDVLLKKLCVLLKKFAYENFPVKEEQSKTARNRIIANDHNSKKSILHVLKLLLPELNSTSSNDAEAQIVKIDETIPHEILEFLFSADIIEKCPDNPNFIRLIDS